MVHMVHMVLCPGMHIAFLDMAMYIAAHGTCTRLRWIVLAQMLKHLLAGISKYLVPLVCID